MPDPGDMAVRDGDVDIYIFKPRHVVRSHDTVWLTSSLVIQQRPAPIRGPVVWLSSEPLSSHMIRHPAHNPAIDRLSGVWPQIQ